MYISNVVESVSVAVAHRKLIAKAMAHLDEVNLVIWQ